MKYPPHCLAGLLRAIPSVLAAKGPAKAMCPLGCANILSPQQVIGSRAGKRLRTAAWKATVKQPPKEKLLSSDVISSFEYTSLMWPVMGQALCQQLGLEKWIRKAWCPALKTGSAPRLVTRMVGAVVRRASWCCGSCQDQHFCRSVNVTGARHQGKPRMVCSDTCFSPAPECLPRDGISGAGHAGSLCIEGSQLCLRSDLQPIPVSVKESS